VCYSYLRAEVPVILCVDLEGSGHAITITGYKLDETFPEINEYELIEPSMKNFHVKGSRIKKLYAHDDQIGPFSKIDINLNVENRSIEMTTDWTYEDGTPKSVIPYNLIVPIYHKIRLPINPMMKYINMLDNLFKSINIFSDNRRFEWDCYLTNINDYKSEMLNDPQLIDKSGILMSSYPRFFWRFKAIYNDDILFELLADATDMERSFQFININFYSEEVLSIFKGLFNSANRDFLIKCLTREMHDFIHEEL
ncbi:MAG: hypothetical protein KAH57_05450, partial [Thermoplasmata archaeon]|nr:hypothetical protein [Thermoplasmata archaeon]